MVFYLLVIILLINNKFLEVILVSFCEIVSSYMYILYSQLLLYVVVFGQGLIYMYFNFVGSLLKMKVEF